MVWKETPTADFPESPLVDPSELFLMELPVARSLNIAITKKSTNESISHALIFRMDSISCYQFQCQDYSGRILQHQHVNTVHKSYAYGEQTEAGHNQLLVGPLPKDFQETKKCLLYWFQYFPLLNCHIGNASQCISSLFIHLSGTLHNKDFIMNLIYNLRIPSCIISLPGISVTHPIWTNSIFLGFTSIARPFQNKLIHGMEDQSMQSLKIPSRNWPINQLHPSTNISKETTPKQVRHITYKDQLTMNGPQGSL